MWKGSMPRWELESWVPNEHEHELCFWAVEYMYLNLLSRGDSRNLNLRMEYMYLPLPSQLNRLEMAQTRWKCLRMHYKKESFNLLIRTN